jgi:S1-C subfamily serine protease
LKEEENISLFDFYLSGEMSESEKTAFEKRLSNETDLKTDFDAYATFSSEIKEGAKYAEIRNELSEIHTNLYSKKKPIILRAKFIVPLAIAASITFLVLIFPNFNEGSTANEDSGYQPLTHISDDSIETDDTISLDSTNSLIEDDNGYGHLADSLRTIISEPRGTSFIISKNGYFLTSKHLVHKRRYVKLQQSDLGITFKTEVVYRDSILDFAILKCSDRLTEKFNRIPFKFSPNEPALGDEVFTLGYPKSDIVYTKGAVSSETGFKSDSMYFQISMPSNPGYSGGPLFTSNGDLVGIITANHSKKQSVTYVLKHTYIKERIDNLNEKHDIDMSRNYSKRYKKVSLLIKKYRPFIFEVH